MDPCMQMYQPRRGWRGGRETGGDEVFLDYVITDPIDPR